MPGVVELDAVDRLAARFGVDAAFLRQVDALGQLPREPDGAVAGAAARRAQLLAFALRHGIDRSALLTAMASYGDLFVAFDGLGLTPAPDDDRATVLAEIGLDQQVAEQISAAGGAPFESAMTVEDIGAMRTAKQALDLGLPLPVLLQLVRVFADNMDRLAQAENRIFHDHVHERFRAEGLSGRALMEATAGISGGLLDLVEPTVLYFHRRAWAAAAQHDFIRHLTEDSRPVRTAPGAAPCVVMFVDLTGFTPLTAAMGDLAAAEVLSRFGAAVRRITTEHDGTVAKQIGDAFMLVFEDRAEAVGCGAALLAWCEREPRFPPLHVGAHSGEVLFHDGDYVGAAVNLAARVAAVTEPSQFLVTDALLDGVQIPAGLSAVQLGPRQLKGVAEPVPVTEISVGTGSTRERDPVCGMALDPGGIAREMAGRTWTFCSDACAQEFDAAPDRYV